MKLLPVSVMTRSNVKGPLLVIAPPLESSTVKAGVWSAEKISLCDELQAQTGHSCTGQRRGSFRMFRFDGIEMFWYFTSMSQDGYDHTLENKAHPRFLHCRLLQK